MMKRILVMTLLVLVAAAAQAQVDDAFEKAKQQMMQEFMNFDQKAKSEYVSFRDKCNLQYADFMRQAWKSFVSNEPLEDPTDKIPEVPPVVAPIEEQKPPVKDQPKPVPVVVEPPSPSPAPQPVEPLPNSNPAPAIRYCQFNLFGTPCKVRNSITKQPRLQSADGEQIAQMWETLAEQSEALIYDCLELRRDMQLCDWAYLQMVETVTAQIYSTPNEATILQNVILVNSGFDIRMAIEENGRLHNLVHTHGELFDYSYFDIEGKHYYWLQKNPGRNQLQIMPGAYPQSSPLRLAVVQENLFATRVVPSRQFSSERYPSLSIETRIDKNQIDFYSTYPKACDKGNPYAKWRYYAETPLSKTTRESLYPILREKISGKSQKEAAEMLLNWVQTSIEYKYDDEIWGEDRAFFGEETLYYPYADCEDRSILFSHLMRDLLGLDVLLIYYPGHLATAVRYTDPAVHGDYLVYNGQRYYISDPTFIGAPIGRTMTGMNNAEAVAIPVKKIHY